MSPVKTLTVYHIRNHDEKRVDFSPHTTMISGKNGTGKTSLIEALYITLRGSSFRGSDNEVLQKDADWYRIDVEFSNNTVRTVTFDPNRQNGKKTFQVDGKKYFRLSVQHKQPVVLFEPEDLRLIIGSPTRRRFFIDHFISQINPKYQTSLRKYERALRQRNHLLKQPGIASDQLFVWNVALSEYGAYIIAERSHYVERINSQLTNTYQVISETNDVVSIHYSHTLIDTIQQKLLTELSHGIERDTLLGFTSVGPHRDDILFVYNDTPAAKTASRGETKTIVLALKYIEAQLIDELLDEKPILLFDDVFSELDESRQKQIKTTSTYQTIITKASNQDLSVT